MSRFILTKAFLLFVLSCNTNGSLETRVHDINYSFEKSQIKLCQINLPKSYYEYKFVTNLNEEYNLGSRSLGNFHVYHDSTTNSYINLFVTFPTDTFESLRNSCLEEIRYRCSQYLDTSIEEFPSNLVFLNNLNYILFRNTKAKMNPLINSIETISYYPEGESYNYSLGIKYIKYTRLLDGRMINIGYDLLLLINSMNIDYLKENFYGKELVFPN